MTSACAVRLAHPPAASLPPSTPRSSFIRAKALGPLLYPQSLRLALPGAPATTALQVHARGAGRRRAGMRLPARRLPALASMRWAFTHAPARLPPRLLQPPQGLLEVRVVEAANLPRMNWTGGPPDFPGGRPTLAPCLCISVPCPALPRPAAPAPAGGADPFVRLWVRESSKFRTSVRSRTLHPCWDEQFTLIVHAASLQTLTLVLYDSGGRAPPATLPASRWARHWMGLERDHSTPQLGGDTAIRHTPALLCMPPAADTLLPDEEVGRAEVPLASLDLSPAAQNDLWLPLVPPYRQKHSRRSGRRRLALSRHGSLEGDAAAVAGTVASGGSASAQLEGRGDAASGSNLLQRIGSSSAAATAEQAAAAQGPQPRRTPLQRLTAAPAALAAALGSAAGGGSRDPQLHVQCSFSAFSPVEQEAAGAARQGGPGIVQILRRLSRQSKVPALLRSGVLGVALERAEGLSRRGGFTRN